MRVIFIGVVSKAIFKKVDPLCNFARHFVTLCGSISYIRNTKEHKGYHQGQQRLMIQPGLPE